MDKTVSTHIETKNTVDDIASGVGILCGRPEVTGRTGYLVLSIICVIITIIFVWSSFIADTVIREDIIISTIYILITLSCVLFTVFIFTYPSRPKKKLVFEGVWFSKEKIWLGEHEIVLQKECSINNLINKKHTNRIHAKWKQTKRVSCIDRTKVSMVLQVVDSKYDNKDYIIEKIHILKGKDDLHYDFLATPTILIINGILYSCKMLTLIEQLKKIAAGMKPFQKNGNICNLVISSQSDTNASFPIITNNIEELKKAIQNKKTTNQTMNALQKKEFIDKRNSDFIIKLSEDHGWKVIFAH